MRYKLNGKSGAWIDFKCPVCGSTYFRTDGRRGSCKGKLLTGKDQFPITAYSGCSFTWDRDTEDPTCFTRFIEDKPRTIEEIIQLTHESRL